MPELAANGGCAGYSMTFVYSARRPGPPLWLMRIFRSLSRRFKIRHTDSRCLAPVATMRAGAVHFGCF